LSSSAQYIEALRLLELAINRDPHYGPALAWAAFCCHRLLLEGRGSLLWFMSRSRETFSKLSAVAPSISVDHRARDGYTTLVI
jgi:hypothetical protein